MFHQRRRHTICFAKAFERRKKSCMVFPSQRQVQSYRRNGKRLRPARRRWKSTRTFMKKRKDDMKKPYRDIRKIIWMKWRLLTFTKGVIRRLERSYGLKKYPKQARMTQLSKKNRSGQAMKKSLQKRQRKKLKRPRSRKKHQNHLNLLTQMKKKKK